MCNPSQQHSSSTTPLSPLLPLNARSRFYAGSEILGLRAWYFFYFAAQFTQLFLPLVLEKVMLFQSSTIGLLMAIRRFTIFLIAPLFAILCDMSFLHRQLLTMAHACYYFCTFLLTQVRSLAPVTVIIILREAFIAGCEPAVNTAAFAKLASIYGPGPQSASRFGTIRVWGSMGWGLASLLVPIISERFFASSMVPILYAQIVLGIPTLLIVGLGVDLSPRLFREAQEIKPAKNKSLEEENEDRTSMMTIREDRHVVHDEQPHDIENLGHPEYDLPSENLTASSSPSSGPTSYSSISQSPESSTMDSNQHQPEIHSQQSTQPEPSHQTSKRLAILCVLAAFDQGVILGTIQTTLLLYFAASNVSIPLIGLSVLVGCMSEGSMFFADRWVRRYFKSDRHVIQFGILTNGISLLTYISIHYIPESLWWRPLIVLITEMLNGSSYALFVSSILQMADRVAPPEWQTGGQGVVTSVLYGVGPAVGALVGGWTYQQYGVDILYGTLAALNTIVFFLLAL